ncbi:hypothetical protein FHG87_024378 [Trinorchestia longiramus]|nr:hypothetical protein FHG87_024378 [Trinorchestia longiramus]
MIPELLNLSYERHLQQLELVSLEQKRLRGQLIETFKYVNSPNDVTLEGLFEREKMSHALVFFLLAPFSGTKDVRPGRISVLPERSCCHGNLVERER